MVKRGPRSALSCLVTAILVCLFFGAGLAVTLIVRRVTEQPFDDSDMIVVRPEIPDDHNAYLLLHKGAVAVRWDENENDSIELMIEGTPEPADFPEQFLQSNQDALALVRKALDCEQSAFKDFEITDESIARDHAVEAVMWAQWHEIRRNEDEARQIDFAVKVIRLGHKRKISGGPLIEFYRGQRFQAYGFRMLSQVIAADDPSVDSLTSCIAALAAVQDDSSAVADALRVEYAAAKEFIDKELGSREWQFWVYDEDKNRRAMLREYRTLIESGDEVFEKVVIPPERGTDNSLLMVLKGNALGDILSGLALPFSENTFKGLAFCRSQNSAVQVLLALKIYHLRHGELPDSLDALVPEFFDELPKDWFDGGPIKYNRAKAIVYCVGPDLQDQGGSDPDQKWGVSEDPSWSIPFARRTEQPRE